MNALSIVQTSLRTSLGATLFVAIAGCGDSASPAATSDAGIPMEGSTHDTSPVDSGVKIPGKGAVARGESFFGFPERFNRYYTDPTWQPSKVLWVGPEGSGDGSSEDSPTSVATGLAAVQPGSMLVFKAGEYEGCFEVPRGGTYDEPIVLSAQRNPDGTRGVTVDCCSSGRRTCFNLEAVDYVAIEGFSLRGGAYGIRAVGSDYAAEDHQQGVAMLDNEGGHQDRDPFFTGQSDWVVVEGNHAHHAGSGDGHGIYLSNGSDWGIVRFNDLHDNVSSDLQINADPLSTCSSFDDSECAGTAEDGLGRGASDYFLIEGNYLHNNQIGPNFTSVRRSVIRNNVSGFHARHNMSFWQETDNPALGSSDNVICHNLFIGINSRHLLQFINDSTRNVVRNNLFLGLDLAGSSATASDSPELMQVDGTTGQNTYAGNYFVGGYLTGREPNSEEFTDSVFDPNYFESFPLDGMGSVLGFVPRPGAPFLDKGKAVPECAKDYRGVARSGAVDIGPFEVP